MYSVQWTVDYTPYIYTIKSNIRLYSGPIVYKNVYKYILSIGSTKDYLIPGLHVCMMSNCVIGNDAIEGFKL